MNCVTVTIRNYMCDNLQINFLFERKNNHMKILISCIFKANKGRYMIFYKTF